MKKVVVILLTLISLYSNAQVVDKVTSIEDQNIATIETKDPCSEIDRIMNASFECDTVFDCGTDSVTYGGQVYHTVQIGDQCWFKENLNIGNQTDALLIPSETHNSQPFNGEITKFCYNNDPTYCNSRGGLYQFWNAVRTNPNVGSNTFYYQGTMLDGVQGICPTGWHIPSGSEFNTLSTYLTNMNYDGGTLKKEGEWDGEYDANNITGFSAIPTGVYCAGNEYYSQCTYCGNNEFIGENTFTIFMSTTIIDNDLHSQNCFNQHFYARGLTTNYNLFSEETGAIYTGFHAYIHNGLYSGGNAVSVRCIKND